MRRTRRRGGDAGHGWGAVPAAASRRHRGAGVTVYLRVDDIDGIWARHEAAGVTTTALSARPASLALLGDAAGQRVLDAGCGAGAHAAELVKRGAHVTGLDKSVGLLAIARQRLGAGVPLHEGDLTDPLPFPSAGFEAVLASLVVHYLEDWGPMLVEFRRILVPGGRLVISTHHPFMDHPLGGGPSYFATYDFTEEWTKGGQTVLMRFWHRPLHALTDAFQAAGFILDAMREPEPDPAAETLFPAIYADLRTNPRFLFFRLIAP